jgi:hypothetical protein
MMCFNDVLQFGTDDLQNLFFGNIEDRFIARAAEKAANDSAVFGRAVRKLVMDEGGGEHASAFAAGHEESETGRQGSTDSLIVSEGDGDRGTVADGGKFVCHGATGRTQERRGSRRGHSEDDSVEMIGVESGGNRPTPGLGYDGFDVDAYLHGAGIEASDDGIHHLLHAVLERCEQRACRTLG